MGRGEYKLQQGGSEQPVSNDTDSVAMDPQNARIVHPGPRREGLGARLSSPVRKVVIRMRRLREHWRLLRKGETLISRGGTSELMGGTEDGSERFAGQAKMSTCHTGLAARPPLQKKGRKILSIGSSKN